MIAIGCDHVAYEFKLEIIKYLEEKGFECKDYGTYNTDRTDYPIYAVKVANAIVSEECDKGILICGSGVGMSIAANKVKGVRAVLCSEPYSAKLSRQHNDTNILIFGARVIGIEMAKMIVDQWLSAEFEGGRHQDRLKLIKEIEEN